jgi:hypothetical protein
MDLDVMRNSLCLNPYPIKSRVRAETGLADRGQQRGVHHEQHYSIRFSGCLRRRFAGKMRQGCASAAVVNSAWEGREGSARAIRQE